MNHYTYLCIDLLTVLFPVLWSFEKKMYFYSHWPSVFKSILTVGLFFIIWDSLFTYLGVWGFNDDYILGWKILNLPIEEIFFFAVVPFSSLFIYASVSFLWKNPIKQGLLHQWSLMLSLILLIIGVVNYEKWYTCLSCIGSATILAYHCAMKKSLHHEKFWVSYFIVLFPFVIVNGILTGFFTPNPIVWYNNNEILGIRFLTIPLEDFIYNLFLMLLNVTLYEYSYLKSSK